MELLLIFIVYVLAIYLSIFKPSYYVILFGVVGSVYDGFGIGAYINNYTQVHYIYFYVLLYIALISSFIFLSKINLNQYKNEITMYLIFTMMIVLSILLYTLMDTGRSRSIFNVIMDAMYKSADFTFVVGIILLLNHDKFNVFKMFTYYIAIQISIAALVIYLPNFGINILEKINGIHYQEIRVHSSPFGATLNNFYEVFSNKYYFNKFAHFHNSNDTGFFFGTALFLSIYKVIERKNVVLYSLLSVFLFIMWSNSGMRAPIVAIIFSLLIYLLLTKISLSKLLLLLFLLLIFVPFLLSDTFDSFSNFFTGLGSSSSSSIIDRLDYISSSFIFLKEHIFIGFGTDLNRLSSYGITPHLLPLKIATMSGILAGIMVFVIVYLHPLYLLIKSKNNIYFAIGIYSLLLFVSITNNYTNIVLFNFLLVALVVSQKEKMNY